ncbi:MAG: type II toxin-antitoxin system RelE/ParE family toxin [Cryomorphaceae bacterium]|nr:type II toxin-antitoxin system RelE/ParE family toxin [Cryomorphaceae bacterium]
MYKAIILPLAKEDIIEAAHYYNEKQKGLGKRFTREVRSKIEYICTNPKSVAVRYDKTRCALLDVFPFMVHFSMDEKQKMIIVSAVFHTSLNPQKWEKR